MRSGPRPKAKNKIAGLCKGSTTDSDSVCEGSNPSPAAILKGPGNLENQGFRGFFVLFDKFAASGFPGILAVLCRYSVVTFFGHPPPGFLWGSVCCPLCLPSAASCFSVSFLLSGLRASSSIGIFHQFIKRCPQRLLPQFLIIDICGYI